MEKLKHIRPTIEYQAQAEAYLRELEVNKSRTDGLGGLNLFSNDYDGWLQSLEEDRNRTATEERVPAETFFLVRESDNKIVGMINIRLALNENLKKFGGHIGYNIRPSERGKGYNKINLFLGLLCCRAYNIEKVLMDCAKENPASARTMVALGGELVDEYFYIAAGCVVQDYWINTEKAIAEHKADFMDCISEDTIFSISPKR